MFQYATRSCSCHCCHCLSATNCDYTKQLRRCLRSLLSSAHSTVHTVGYMYHGRDIAQSAQKCLSRATPDSSTRCSKKPDYLSAPFNSVVKHILILSPKLTDCSVSRPSWLQRPDKVTNKYKFLCNEAQIKPSVLRTSKTAANK